MREAIGFGLILIIFDIDTDNYLSSTASTNALYLNCNFVFSAFHLVVNQVQQKQSKGQFNKSLFIKSLFINSLRIKGLFVKGLFVKGRFIKGLFIKGLFV